MTEQSTKRTWSLPGLTSATLEAIAFGILGGLSLGVIYAQIRSPGLLPRAIWFTVFAATLALIAYALRRTLGGWSWRDLGFQAPRGVLGEIRRGAVAFALLFLVSLPVSIALLPSLAAKWAEWDDVPPAVGLPMALVLTLWPATVTGFFTGALYEEIQFRGYLQGLFHREGSAVIGFLASWIPFSFGHYFSHPEWTFVQVLNTVLPGAFFCLAYLATRSLVAAVTAHALVNSVPIIPMYVQARGSVTGSHVALALLAACSVLVLLYWRKDTLEILRAAWNLATRARLVDVVVGLVIGTLLLLRNPTLRSAKEALALGDGSYTLLLLGLAATLVGIAALLRRVRD